jgi:F-type H+-transporting ATPase subunit alpha
MLKNGERLMELLKQKQDQLFKLSEQTAILLAVTNGVFKPYNKRDIDDVRTALLKFLHQNAESVMTSIDATGKLSEEDKTDMLRAFERFAAEGGENNGESI